MSRHDPSLTIPALSGPRLEDVDRAFPSFQYVYMVDTATTEPVTLHWWDIKIKYAPRRWDAPLYRFSPLFHASEIRDRWRNATLPLGYQHAKWLMENPQTLRSFLTGDMVMMPDGYHHLSLDFSGCILGTVHGDEYVLRIAEARDAYCTYPDLSLVDWPLVL